MQNLEKKTYPSDNQIREFWEKLDCLKIKQYPSTHPLLGSQRVMINAWCWKATGERISHQIGDYSGMPKPDLNDLFKYAVPKLFSCELETLSNLGEEGYEAFVNYGKPLGSEGYSARDKDPALALFWAIWEVINAK